MVVAINLMFVSPTKFTHWSPPPPNMMVLGDVTFGTWLGCKSGASANGVSAFMRETPESSFTSLYHERIWENSSLFFKTM